MGFRSDHSEWLPNTSENHSMAIFAIGPWDWLPFINNHSAVIIRPGLGTLGLSAV